MRPLLPQVIAAPALKTKLRIFSGDPRGKEAAIFGDRLPSVNQAHQYFVAHRRTFTPKRSREEPLKRNASVTSTIVAEILIFRAPDRPYQRIGDFVSTETQHPIPATISKAEVMMRLQEIEKALRELAIIVENSDILEEGAADELNSQWGINGNDGHIDART